MFVIESLKKFAFSVLLIVLACIECVAMAGRAIGVVAQSCDVIAAENVNVVKNVIKMDYNPLMGQIGRWQGVGHSVGALQMTPVQLGKCFYDSDLGPTLRAFNIAAVSNSNHCSICAITYVYDLKEEGANVFGEHVWLVNTMLLDALFVSGAYGAVPNGLFMHINMNRGIVSPWGTPIRPININDVFCFPSKAQGLHAHSEKAITSLLPNTSLNQLPVAFLLIPPTNPSAVIIHVQNIMRSCLNCYQAMLNSAPKKVNACFLNAKGFVDIYSDGRDPIILGGNNLQVGRIPVSVGIGHYIEPRLPMITKKNIDWIDRY